MSQSTRSVDRALDVLLCFSRQNPELSLTEISKKVELHKSTVHRILTTLEKKRFVKRDETTGTYSLGINLLHMAYLTLNQSDLRRIAARYLHQLSEKFRETVNLAILDNADVIYLDVVESPQRVKLAAAIGQRLPAFCTASGKAILAFSTKETVKQVLEYGMNQYTQCTMNSPEKFMENMKETQERGFAMSLEEYEAGINAIAAPILDRNKKPLASVAVAGPSYRLTKERMIEIGNELLIAVQEISQEVEISSRI
jgi:DNA-binding IclR family transcriptional regulator